MAKRLIIAFIFCSFLNQGGAQQNWAPVPCYEGKWEIAKMFVDSLHDEIILNNKRDYHTCDIDYKAILAYNGMYFHNLDRGLDTHNSQPNTNGDIALGSITYNGKTLFGGAFSSVGSNTLQSEALALWNGAVWDTFPKKAFKYNPGRSNPVKIIIGFLKDNSKLWIYGQFDTLGGVAGSNLYTFDGTSYSAVNIPVNNNNNVSKLIKYKNKIYATGLFYDYPSWSIARISMYDGINWSSVGNGIKGGLDNIFDMAVYKDTLYIAGAFSKASGNVANYIMKWDGTQLSEANFGGFYGWGGIKQLIVYKDRLYAFGNFTYAADQKAFGVAYYENNQWIVPQDSIAGGIMNAVLYKDEIYISGNFIAINSDTAIKYFAKLRCPDFESVCTTGLKSYNQKTIDIKIYPNPVSVKLNIEFETNESQKVNLQITNSLGQVIFISSNLNQKQELDLSFLSSGIYFLKLQNNSDQKIFKVVKE